jgi:hypothetical protein
VGAGVSCAIAGVAAMSAMADAASSSNFLMVHPLKHVPPILLPVGMVSDEVNGA